MLIRDELTVRARERIAMRVGGEEGRFAASGVMLRLRRPRRHARRQLRSGAAGTGSGAAGRRRRGGGGRG